MDNLAISILGSHDLNIIHDLCKLANQSGCRIVDARGVRTTSHFSGSFLLSGSWNTLAKFETSFPTLQQKFSFQSIVSRVKPMVTDNKSFPYQLYIIALEESNPIPKITEFLFEHNLTIHDCLINTYKAPVTELPMLAMTSTILIPEQRLVAEIREDFVLFCDMNNYDAVMEPYKPFFT